MRKRNHFKYDWYQEDFKNVVEMLMKILPYIDEYLLNKMVNESWTNSHFWISRFLDFKIFRKFLNKGNILLIK